MTRHFRTWIALVILLGLTACRQGLNDRCQVNSDCQDALLCVYPPGATPQTGGTCQTPSSGVDMSDVDMVGSDRSTMDALVDATVDATPIDLAAADAGDMTPPVDSSGDRTGEDL